MSYCDVGYADVYMSIRVFAEKWESEGVEKEKLLETASRMIRDYCTFEDENGIFVYGEDDEQKRPIPGWLKRATCEQALYLLNLGKDPTQADKKTTLGISSTDGTTFDKTFAADVLGEACRLVLEAHGVTVASEATAGSSGGTYARWSK